MNGDNPSSAVGKMRFEFGGRTLLVSRFTFLMIMGAVVGALTALVTEIGRAHV